MNDFSGGMKGISPGNIIEETQRAALDVLLHNARGPYDNLPRAAGWGYPEPYTRDLMIAALGILTTGDAVLIESLRRVLKALANSQSQRGLIPGLAHHPEDRGSSDTTPLFLIGLALFRWVTGEAGFLNPAAQKALHWMEFQSPEDRELVAQQPTSDWRDEQWVLGYGLYVNVLVYIYSAAVRPGRSGRADARSGSTAPWLWMDTSRRMCRKA